MAAVEGWVPLCPLGTFPGWVALPWAQLALLEGEKVHREHLERGQGCCAHKTPRGGIQGKQGWAGQQRAEL